VNSAATDDWASWEVGERLFLEKLSDLLAWLLAVKSHQVSPTDRIKWPILDLWRYQETRELAQSGPIFFDLARNQLAVDFADDPESFAQYDQHTDVVSQFMLIDRPTNGQGKASGRAEMKALVQLMFQVHRPFNFWELPVHRAANRDGFSESLHTASAFAVTLSDRLNTPVRIARRRAFPGSAPTTVV
jgi:hypothetical protein